MSETLDSATLKSQLLASSGSPSWLEKFLTTVPGGPADVTPHNKPRHPQTSSYIADAFLHPAMEACLHLINTDLYSAHFLVRKAQGGAKYMDWLHAILHKLEGDFRNAKMWYTDLSNSTSCPAFAEFWRTSSQDAQSSSTVVQLTAAQHTDLIAVTSATPASFRPQQYYESTTASADKIKYSGLAYSLARLQELAADNASDQQQRARNMMQFELVWLLHRMQSEYGWNAMDAAASTSALREQAQGNDDKPDASDDAQRKEDAHNMVFGRSGQRRF